MSWESCMFAGCRWMVWYEFVFFVTGTIESVVVAES